MSIPNTYTNKNETGCCPVPNIKDWDKKEVKFENKKFIRMYTNSIMYVPINMGKVMTALDKCATGAKAKLPMEQGMILSRDISPWKSEQLYAVSGDVDCAENVVLDGTFLSLVVEGPYQNAPKWIKSMQEYAKEKGKKIGDIFSFIRLALNAPNIMAKIILLLWPRLFNKSLSGIIKI